jgi:hypothetical protein
MSLKLALEQLLGGRCHHMIEMFGDEDQMAGWTKAIEGRPVDWSALLSPFVAQVDWPGASFWPELSAANPDALVILSVRKDPAAWYRSATDTIFTTMVRSDEEAAAIEGIGPWLGSVRRLLDERFCARFDDPDAMMAAYERHNDAVRKGVDAGRLLEWTPGDGWDPICDRLGLPVPVEPFPHANTTEDFRAMFAAMQEGELPGH